jgi:MFS family permease
VTAGGDSATDKHDAYAALRVPNYRWFILGWLPASMGLQMQGTALGWEVYERTQNPLALGLIGLMRVIPVVLLALPAGQIIDLVNRRRVLMGTQVAFAFASTLLVAASIGWERGWLGTMAMSLVTLYLIVALTGCARVFNGPGRSSLLPTILPGGAGGEVFHNAITWNSGTFQLAATAGPLLAGVMIDVTGKAWPVYAVAALTSLWFAVTLRRVRPLTGEGPAPAARGLWNTIRPEVLVPGMLDGVRHMWREKTVLGAITLDLFAVLLGGATALMPMFAKDILKVGATELGVLKAAPYVGALVMAFILAHRRPFERAGRALLLSVALYGLCTIGFGLSTNFALSVALLVLLGAADNISVVIRHVLVSSRTPDRLRGRVSAVNSVFIECSNELGGFQSGLFAYWFGAVFSVVSGGVGALLVVAGVAWWLPELRRLGRLQGTPEAAEVAESQAAGRGESSSGAGKR